jgi:hypothetical protein
MVQTAESLSKQDSIISEWAEAMDNLRIYVFDRWVASRLQKPDAVAHALFASLFSTNAPQHVMVDSWDKRLMWTVSSWQSLLDNVLYLYWPKTSSKKLE